MRRAQAAMQHAHNSADHASVFRLMAMGMCDSKERVRWVALEGIAVLGRHLGQTSLQALIAGSSLSDVQRQQIASRLQQPGLPRVSADGLVQHVLDAEGAGGGEGGSTDFSSPANSAWQSPHGHGTHAKLGPGSGSMWPLATEASAGSAYSGSAALSSGMPSPQLLIESGQLPGALSRGQPRYPVVSQVAQARGVGSLHALSESPQAAGSVHCSGTDSPAHSLLSPSTSTAYDAESAGGIRSTMWPSSNAELGGRTSVTDSLSRLRASQQQQQQQQQQVAYQPSGWEAGDSRGGPVSQRLGQPTSTSDNASAAAAGYHRPVSSGRRQAGILGLKLPGSAADSQGAARHGSYVHSLPQAF